MMESADGEGEEEEEEGGGESETLRLPVREFAMPG